MNKKLAGLICATALLGTGSANAGVMPSDSKLVIDLFSTPQLTQANFTTGGANQVVAPDAIGGYRDVLATQPGTTGFVSAAINQANLGYLAAAVNFTGASNIVVTWDGSNLYANADGTVNGIDNTGLTSPDNPEQGIDLGIKGLWLDLVDFNSFGHDVTATMSIWNYGGSSFSATHTLGAPEFSYFRFDEFGPGLDPSNVGAIQLNIASTGNPQGAYNARFDFVTAVPVPAPLALIGLGLIGLGLLRKRISG